MVSSEEFENTFAQIKDLHVEVFRKIDKAVKLEEEEKPLEALSTYKESIEEIDKTLSTPVGVPDDLDEVRDDWNEACKIIHKLKRARAEVLQRIGILKAKHEPSVALAEEATENDEPVAKKRPIVVSDKKMFETLPENGRPRTYSELADALQKMKCDKSEDQLKKLELIFSCEGVRLYQIKPNGSVTTTSEDSILRILRLEKDEKKNLNTTFFIQTIKSSNAVEIVPIEIPDDDDSQSTPTSSPDMCEDACMALPQDNFDNQDNSSWIYPLIPGVSPCFRTEYGAFIFPDLENSEYGTSFGLMIPSKDQTDEVVLEILEAILLGVVLQLKEGDKKRATRDIRQDSSTLISQNLIRGANFISRNLLKGAEKTGQFISYSTPYIISKMQAAPEDSPPVSSKVQTTVEVAKSVTGVAASVTGYIAGKVGSATMSLGRYLAPHIQKHGSTLLSKTMGVEENEAQEKMEGVFTVAAGAVEGFGTIYAGLEDSAKILGNNLSNNSVKIIEHKYGQSAGCLASETFDTVGNVINVSQNVNYMTPKGIAKRTAKDAGKAIVEDFRPMRVKDGKFITAASMYPDLKVLENEIIRK